MVALATQAAGQCDPLGEQGLQWHPVRMVEDAGHAGAIASILELARSASTDPLL